jgi:SAM-dependent methyltransferase
VSRPAQAAHLDPKRANALYHDAAARTYDAKWAISFDDRSIRYVRERAQRMLPRRRYGRVLEIGAGTGFFVLNLWQAGFVEEPHATDLSPGMLAVCVENARGIGCDLRVRTADAEALPFDDGTFDLVVGHAVLHHLPAPAAAVGEAFRVLAPGGSLFIAGEPTRRGDRRARRVGRLISRAVRAAGRAFPAMRRPPEPEPSTERDRVLRDLQWDVDLHTFVPADVEAMARATGFRSVRVETEELVSSVWGWAVRTFEAEVPSGLLGWGWARFAYRSWLALYRVDRLLYGLVPKDRFYNLLLFGEKDG